MGFDRKRHRGGSGWEDPNPITTNGRKSASVELSDGTRPAAAVWGERAAGGWALNSLAARGGNARTPFTLRELTMLNLLRSFLPRDRRPGRPAQRTSPLAVTRLEDRDVPVSPVNFVFNLSGNFGLTAAQQSLFQANLNTAGQLWSSKIEAAATSSVTIEVSVTPANLGNTTLAQTTTTGLNSGGYLEPYALFESRTGIDPNGTTADFAIAFSTAFLQSTSAFFDPTGLLRNDPVPNGKVDVVSVALHELGHGLGFNTARNSNGTIPAPALPWLFDTKVRVIAPSISDLAFDAPRARAAYGHPVPVGSNQGSYSHLGNSTELTNDLMYASLDAGQQKSVSDVDQGILLDLGWHRRITEPAANADAVSTSKDGAFRVRANDTGVWRYSLSTGWVRLSTAPAVTAAVNNTGDVAAGFGANGSWLYTASTGTWAQLSTPGVSTMSTTAAVNNNRDVVYGGSGGLWLIRNGVNTPVQISAVAASSVSVNDDADVAAGFNPGGVWLLRSGQNWVQLSAAPASLVAINNSDTVVAGFGENGVWKWTDTGGAGTWAVISGANANSVAVNDAGDVAAGFSSAGVWLLRSGQNWVQISSALVSAVSITATADVLAGFGPSGIWWLPPGQNWVRL